MKARFNLSQSARRELCEVATTEQRTDGTVCIYFQGIMGKVSFPERKTSHSWSSVWKEQ